MKNKIRYLLFGAISIFIIAAGYDLTMSNYSTQAIMNFVYGVASNTTASVPDSSLAVNLKPDHIIWDKEISLSSIGTDQDTIDLKSKYSKRYKFSITVETGTIYAKLFGPGTDSVRIRPGETLTRDYLHPIYDSSLVLIDSSSSAVIRFISQGR